MKNIFKLIWILVPIFFFSQKKDTNWYAFYNQDSTKIGFKDVDGNIKQPAKFEPFMTEQIFKKVIAVSEDLSSGMRQTYYLNKDGKIFGKDSIYIFDFEYASESDGKIKFKDYKSDRVGFFNVDGKVVIPAIYDDACDFHNGIAVIYKNGKRWCYDNETTNSKNCEHYGWKGGKSFFINSQNRELFQIADRTDFSYSIDYTNFKINEKVDKDVYTSYKGSDGNIYSFYSPEKDFEKWFNIKFLPDFKKNNTVLPEYFYDLISSDDNDNQQNTRWKNHKKEEYLKNKQQKIDEIFRKLLSGEYKKNISWENSMNYSYFPENELPKEDLRNNTIISFLPRKANDFSSINSFQFTKIGNQFYITSAP